MSKRLDVILWQTILSKKIHQRLCAVCGKVIGFDGGDCPFNTHHSKSPDGYDYVCDDCHKKEVSE